MSPRRLTRKGQPGSQRKEAAVRASDPPIAESMADVLPMDIRVADRFTDNGFEWEVLSHPAALHGAKTLRARVRRPELPESERDFTWPAHIRVTIRRGQKLSEDI